MLCAVTKGDNPSAGCGKKGFINAEVISFEDLVATGLVAGTLTKGKARMEVKNYIMQDGGIVEFRFSKA